MTPNSEPAADTSAHPRDADHAAAYRDLDGPLHDLKNTVVLLGTIIGDSFGSSKGRENGSLKLLVIED